MTYEMNADAALTKDDDSLAHYGILRKSGRYPWGSGDNAATKLQRSKRFIDHVAELKDEGLTEQEIAEGFGMTTTQLRATRTIARNVQKQHDISQAQKWRDKGMSNSEIARRMTTDDRKVNESTVRFWLSEGQKEKAAILEATSNMLRDQVAEKKFIQIGTGVGQQLGIADTKLNAAVSILKDEGYTVEKVQVDQIGTGPGKKTTIKVLAPPGTTYRDIASNLDQIQMIGAFTENAGRTFSRLKPPLSIDLKRVGVNYAEDGGSDADGVIYVRPGVRDVSIGGASYAQVRISVNGTHYLKGMAVYKNDLPPGVDLVFNTNKSKTDPKIKAEGKLGSMKPLKDTDPSSTNPFGSSIRRQLLESDGKGDEKPYSSMNIIYEEGDWDRWSRRLSAQTLSKQSRTLAKSQLDMTYEQRRTDLDEIKALTNPAIREKLLQGFADGADSAAVHLNAASLPRASWHVLLPFNRMKQDEIYAPNFRDGERVALIRYPHAGTFEIPELTVNNNIPAAKKAIGRAKDAVGIHSEVAKRLSGADFDGDAVLVIPNNRNIIKSTPALADLKDFDPQRLYKLPDGVEFSGNKQQLMGDVSNLITDMTIKGAGPGDLARAVKHSMVVIDAEKHNLDWKRSYDANGIGALKKKYQGKANAGASTIISRAKSREMVNARSPRPAKDGGPINKKTGELEFVDKPPFLNKQGELVYRKIQSTKLAEAKDAHSITSGRGKEPSPPIEEIYADHSNRLKSLANEARLEMVHTTPIPYSPSARRIYKNEVDNLAAKLRLAISNRPLERQAQLIANAQMQMKRQANPTMDSDTRKKEESLALQEARVRTGADKQQIHIEDREWEAIQHGAVSHSMLRDILNNADIERVKELATPRSSVLMTTTKRARAESMLRSGYTQAEVADALGVSVSTLKRGLGGTA